MPRFDKNYEFQQKFERAKKLAAHRKDSSAKILLKQCVEFFDDENIIVWKLKSLKLLIEVYLNLKKYSKANFLLGQFELESKNYDKSIPPDIYHSYGRLYSNLGNVTKSIESFKTAINISLKMNDQLGAAVSHVNLGEQLRRIGQLEEATKAFRYSIDIFYKNRFEQAALIPLIALLEMLIKFRGRHIPVDIEMIENVLNLPQFPKSPTLATSFINLGVIFQVYGNLDKAFFYLKKAMEISSLLKNNSIYYNACLNLGYIYENKGDFKNAEYYINSSIDYFKRQGDYEHLAKSYNALALIHKNQGNLQDSIKFIKISIEYSNSFYDFELYTRNYILLGELYQDSGAFEDAFLIYLKIFRIYKDLLDRTEFFGIKQIFKEKISEILDLLRKINTLLRNKQFTLTSETIEKVKTETIIICESTQDILELEQGIRVRNETIEIIARLDVLEKENRKLKDMLKDANRRKLEEGLINEICEKIKQYKEEKLTPINIRIFLEQFPNPILRKLFLEKVLYRVKDYFFTKNQMLQQLVEKVQSIPYDEEDIIIYFVLPETWNKSQAFWTYIVDKSNPNSITTEIIKSVKTLKKILNKNINKKIYVLFLDDVIGTGRQFIKFYLKDFENKLVKYGRENILKENVKFYLIAGVLSKESIGYISSKSIFDEKSIKFIKLIRKKDKAFYEKLWNEEEMEYLIKLKDFLKVKDSLNWDGWKKDPNKEHGLEYLVILEWNTPNNTLGCLWNKTENWNPLFFRTN
ncbi:MAG: tetratricopeptide repeat protein [Promethearchaeota archaeon]